MIDKLKYKLAFRGRRYITVQVRELNLCALNFFKRRGFIAIQILPSPYLDSDEDGILMRFELQEP